MDWIQDRQFDKQSTILWLTWALICTLILAIIVPHLNLWPKILQDEVQILDLARAFLNPSTDWSMGWLVHENQPTLATTYLGIIAQELSYNLTAPSNLGPRLFSLIGAITAASLLLKWLLTRGTPAWAALAISVALLLDPMLNDSYRQGRVDSWAFAVIFSACLLLRSAQTKLHQQQGVFIQLFFAGFLVGLSPFVWPTTLALFPLVLLEIFSSVQVNRKKGVHVNSCLKVLIPWFALGGITAVILLAVPIALNWDLYEASIKSNFGVQKTASMIQRSIPGMYAVYDPLIVLAVVASLMIKRELGVLIAIAVAFIMMFQTMIYPMRILYLLPYLVIIIAGAYERASRNHLIKWRHAVLFCTLSMLVIWNAKVSLIDRPLIAFNQKQARSPEQIETVLNNTIGQGNFRVLIVEWDMYFAARALGWKTYKVFGRYNRGKDEFKAFVQTMDYVLIRDKLFPKREVSLKSLEELGFELMETISFDQPQQDFVEFGPIRIESPKIIYEDVMVYRNSLNKNPTNYQ